MFESHRAQRIIPGYTGHIPAVEYTEDMLQINSQKSQIPGYAGYIPSIKSENMFGKTYGKITYQSITKQRHKGYDLPPQLRYTSTVKDEFRDQKYVRKEELVRENTIYQAKLESNGFAYSPTRGHYIDPSEYVEKQ
ncbi:hypothetical protein IMG5_043510, partial [Ichthyophthirius multifiliis]